MILGVQLPSVLVFATVFLSILTFDLASADQWDPSSFVAFCGNGVPSTWLCDPDNLLADGLVVDELASVNNNTSGEIYLDLTYHYGYVIAASVVESVVNGDSEDPSSSVMQFGKAVQKSWFGGRKCDNSTMVLASLNASKVLVFPGSGVETRLRTRHEGTCNEIRIDASNVTDGVIECIIAVDEMLMDALKPYSNAPWGYAGMVVIMTMLVFHYWIKY
ncbi:uncharacterized protein LOC129270590 [Lytechinus pictus]|uniref:uncharacterized protein LOC129270590 n=1 Tax=Lytechinus pictus TaxID=7653 RepID=UPI0030B9DC51